MTVSFEPANTGNCVDDRMTATVNGKKTVLGRGDILRLASVGKITIEIEGEHKGDWAGEIECAIVDKHRRLTEQNLR